MKLLYLIIYVGPLIAGWAGPLPYAAAECERRAAEMNANVAERIAAGTAAGGRPLPPDVPVLRFKCEHRADRPAISLPGKITNEAEGAR